MNQKQIARTAHEVNKAFCEYLEDFSQPKWDDAPDWQRESAISGVKLHLNGNASPVESHESWMKEKINNGWVYGPIKDPKKKTHPCMVPYSELPREQQAKDLLFKAVVDSFK